MSDNIIITFANQKGGVGKTTLCTLFANYLVAHRKKVLVIDCDVQQTISFRRKADLQKYMDVTIPYNIQPFNIANATNVQNLMTNLRKMQGIILIDAPGNLTQQGLIPIFVNSDYVICPFQYEVTSINATATFISFIYKIRAKLSEDVAQLFLVDNSHDKRFGKKEELDLWRMTAKRFSEYGYITPMVEYRAEMRRYTTLYLMKTQEAIISPAFDFIYNHIFIKGEKNGKE
ncbi:MAG: ParA family protein [Bacteroides sp.]|jgi:chromosome partitioning protein|nr:ParA family protein [Bacteroides sp.]